MFQVMLIINTASASGGPYWARSAVHTCWFGQGAVLLGLTGPVGQADLRSVMLGPRTERRATHIEARPAASPWLGFWSWRRPNLSLCWLRPGLVPLLQVCESLTDKP